MQNTRHTAFLLLTFFMLLAGPRAYAQELKFSHISDEQGLSEGVVNCIARDSKGFMWFGTQDGLNRYDGYKITYYRHNPADSNTISNNFIWSIYEDRQGLIWIGTNGGGLNSFNP